MKNDFLIILVLSFVVSFVIFGNGIGGDFVFDDTAVVKNRGDLKDPSYFLHLFVSPYHQNMPKTGLYRPLTMASYSINHNVLGGSAASFRIVNIIIHALNSFLVFWLVSRFLKSRVVAYSSFFLFLAHPIHTEAITSIVGRAELLTFFWSLITVYFFLKNYKLLASISFLFALWSKETALVLLPILLYLELFFANRNLSRAFPQGLISREKVGDLWLAVKNSLFFVLPLGIYSWSRYAALGKYFSGDVTTTIVENQLQFVDFHERIFTALKVLYMYVERLVWPIHLSADYSYQRISIVKNIFSSPEAVLGLLLLSLFVWLAVRYRKTNQGLSFGAVLFIFPYLMVSNLIKPVGTIMGERLMYFPSLGFVILLSLLLDRLYGLAPHLKGESINNVGGSRFLSAGLDKLRRKLFFLALSILLVFYGVRTFVRNYDWKDSRTLFFATVKESPNSLITRTALAGVHIRADEWDKAREQLEIARKIYEDNSHLQNLLGIVADHEGNPQLAEERFKKSLELNPDAINSYINLAELYLKQKKFKEVGDNFLKVIEFYPVAEYVVRYAYAQIAINNPDEALRALNKYMGGNLKHPDISAVVGTAYFVKGDYKEALIYLKNARELGNQAEEIEDMIEIAEEKP